MSRLISVIVPAYNAQDYIGEAILSVISQTYTNWELIVVNDGSLDSTNSIVHEYAKKDDRIKLISTSNQGMGKARNTGIESSKGDLIAFLDADDVWLPNKLMVQEAEFRSDQIGLVFCSGFYFGDVDKSLVVNEVSTLGLEYLNTLVVKNTIPLPSVMVSREALMYSNCFLEDRTLGIVADFQLWIKVCLGDFKVVSLPHDFLFKYRIHGAQSTGEANVIKTTYSVCKMMSELKDDGLLSENLYKKGVQSHFKILLDFLLVDKKNFNSQILKQFRDFKELNNRLDFILFLKKVNFRLAQIVNWRI